MSAYPNLYPNQTQQMGNPTDSTGNAIIQALLQQIPTQIETKNTNTKDDQKSQMTGFLIDLLKAKMAEGGGTV